MNLNFRQLILLPVLSLMLSACAGITYHAESPLVTLAGIKLEKTQPLEQQYQLELRIRNPNETALFINGLTYTLALSGKPLADGVSSQYLEVPGFGERILCVPLLGTTFNLQSQLASFGIASHRLLPYRLAGKVSLGTIKFGHKTQHYSLRTFTSLPFETTGEIDLSRLYVAAH
ncbi:MAG: LEA type 2 family protein [Cycloclasticus sp.]|nr:LEA type 2 family protein [Cycloclasticus sp.]